MLTILEARIIERMAWVLKWHAMVVSGGYKRRQLFHSDSAILEDATPFTNEEKLDDALNIIDNHIHLMNEMIERLPPEPPVEERR